MKKRTKKTDIVVAASGVPGMSAADIQAKMDEESAMQAEMAEIIDTDAKRNDLESYIFNTRDKLNGAWRAFVSDADNEKLSGELMQAEDWLYDNMEGTKT